MKIKLVIIILLGIDHKVAILYYIYHSIFEFCSFNNL